MDMCNKSGVRGHGSKWNSVSWCVKSFKLLFPLTKTEFTNPFLGKTKNPHYAAISWTVPKNTTFKSLRKPITLVCLSTCVGRTVFFFSSKLAYLLNQKQHQCALIIMLICVPLVFISCFLGFFPPTLALSLAVYLEFLNGACFVHRARPWPTTRGPNTPRSSKPWTPPRVSSKAPWSQRTSPARRPPRAWSPPHRSPTAATEKVCVAPPTHALPPPLLLLLLLLLLREKWWSEPTNTPPFAFCTTCNHLGLGWLTLLIISAPRWLLGRWLVAESPLRYWIFALQDTTGPVGGSGVCWTNTAFLQTRAWFRFYDVINAHAPEQPGRWTKEQIHKNK